MGSAVRMIRAIVTSVPVKRGILASFGNDDGGDFATSNGIYFMLRYYTVTFDRVRLPILFVSSTMFDYRTLSGSLGLRLIEVD